ncbi:DUF2071 domain-containing protein [Paenibacillus sp. MZ04-78.2]|uniref:YqjF family protein n=1 Tax=Paenibacillus sp. MZ04-78.2 TaxID=2962034 RepID=UPI0020B8C852|nr:DUF2071 domain-containing protein [Paenibacillus sp. MZ04-78.2]MCP3775561.1 DUF2071 domain-containing protein [Paenibacillus sp. MZ04-78.2]
MESDRFDTAHRPWPLPALPWIMKQTWRNLLFAHWPVPADELRAYVPKELPLDTFEGSAWLAVVPFRMTDIRLRGLPPIPGTSRFPELNVRTYVTLHDKPGVYFFSLDAAHTLAVKLARWLYHLPYYRADMGVTMQNETVFYRSERRQAGPAFAARYRPVSEPYTAKPGSLEHWLTERYCLYTLNGRRDVMRCDIHHQPWPLQKAEAELYENTMLTGNGLPFAPDVPPLLHYAEALEVRVWPLLKVTDRMP